MGASEIAADEKAVGAIAKSAHVPTSDCPTAKGTNQRFHGHRSGSPEIGWLGGRRDIDAALLHYFGRITLSMTWMTPLLATISVALTLAPSTVTPPVVATVISDPWTVLTLPALTSAAMTLPATTW